MRVVIYCGCGPQFLLCSKKLGVLALERNLRFLNSSQIYSDLELFYKRPLRLNDVGRL